MAQLGHDVYATLANLGVPSFAFINGVMQRTGSALTANATRLSQPAPANMSAKARRSFQLKSATTPNAVHFVAAVQNGREGRYGTTRKGTCCSACPDAFLAMTFST